MRPPIALSASVAIASAAIIWVAGGVASVRAADQRDEPWKRICERVKDVPLPAADQPDQAARQDLGGCSSERLFYGIGRARDPERARLCAYLERAAGDELVFGGSSILMTIYATGVGAARNPDLAIRLACDVEGAPAEVEHRVEHLEKLKSAGGKKVEFDICDDVTSGLMEGHCAAHRQRMVKARRDLRYGARLAKWTASQRSAFQKLRAAAGAYFGARSANEVDLGGTARGALQVQEEEELEASFGKLLDELERGALPAATDAELADADHELNATYQRAMTGAKPDWGTVTADGILQAERSWPKYRDAWVAFAKVKYPNADPRALKARLTRDRTDLLRAFAGGPP